MTIYSISYRELGDLLKSTLIVAVVFTIASGRGAFQAASSNAALYIALLFFISLLCAGVGFLIHELMHKIIAQRFGYFAEYFGDNQSYLVSLLFAFGGLALLAPGGVYITGMRPLTRRYSGMISIAGPASNLAIAAGFYALQSISSGIISIAAGMGYGINSWLALFNMIPAGNFDGAKVFAWNKPVYAAFTLACIAAVFLF
jgi:Zn-dependent protease